MLHILALLISLVSSDCSVFLEPECAGCLICDPNNGAVGIYIAAGRSGLTIPSRIGTLSNITYAVISSPVDALPTQLGLLTKLAQLRIDSSPLTRGFPALRNLTQLQRLDIRANGVIEGYDEIYSMSLTHLRLAITDISQSFDLQRFTTPDKLLVVDIDGIALAPLNLMTLTQLTSLSLANNRLGGTLPSTLPPALRTLRITNNGLVGTLPVYANLTSLTLSKNYLTGTILPALGNISTLILDNNNFTTLALIPTTITYLDVSYNALTAAQPPYAPQLYYVDVSYNQYTTITTPEYLNNVGAANGFLNIAGNRISDSNVLANIRRAIKIVTPQDVDECTLGTHQCGNNSDCIDGWSPRMSYTCKCYAGYRQFGNECVDIDECSEGNNCTFRSQCINTVGGYHCCETGYAAVDGKCADINECLPNIYGLNDDCGRVDACVNLPGTYACCSTDSVNTHPEVLNATCAPCIARYTPVVTNPSPFAIISIYNGFRHQHCVGVCDDGTLLSTSPLQSKGCATPLVQTESCSYACSGLSELTEPRAVIRGLLREFERGDFLSDVMMVLYNATIALTPAYNESTASLAITGIPFKSAVDIIYNLTLTIVPGITGLDLNYDNGTLTLSTSAPPAGNGLLSVVIGVAIASGVVIALVGAGCWWYRRFDYGLLPSAVTWSYELANNSVTSWSYRGSNETGYYYKKLVSSDTSYSKVLSYVNLSAYNIASITLVANLTLLSNFVGAYSVVTQRLEQQQMLFGKRRWSQGNIEQQRTYDHYTTLVGTYPWCRDRVPVIPVCHGTSGEIAEKICETGFANLSTTDAGWYGKGIYFTSYADYCLPYVANHRRPVIILSWLIPGNIYPVAPEDTSLVGAALKSGYQSHYIRTYANGKPAHNAASTNYNEIVVAQESQIVPFALVDVDPNSIEATARLWQQRSQAVTT